MTRVTDIADRAALKAEANALADELARLYSAEADLRAAIQAVRERQASIDARLYSAPVTR